MTAVALESHGNGLFALHGDVTQHTVPELLAGSATLWGGPAATIDLAGVDRIDSAAVALLLEWAREAAARGTTMTLSNVPSGVRAIADLCGVAAFVPDGSSGCAPDRNGSNDG